MLGRAVYSYLLFCSVAVSLRDTQNNTSAANVNLNRLREVLILVNSLMTVCVEASQGKQLPHTYVGLISHGKNIEN